MMSVVEVPSDRMRALLVFDKFKDSMSASQAVDAAAAGVSEAIPGCEIDCCSLTDGGEGFAEILTTAAGGSRHTIIATGPRGAPIEARFGLVEASGIPLSVRQRLGGNVTRIGIVEMAQASGLALLRGEERDPWHTTSEGTGQLLVAAWRAGADVLLLGVGGSATNDLGLGALSALGVIPIAEPERAILPPIPARWGDIQSFVGQVPAGLPPIRIACDVSNPLLGPTGCAAVYGPQKGLRAVDLGRLEAQTVRIAALLCAANAKSQSLWDTPGAGAAGGIAFGLMAAADATLLPGFELVAEWLDLKERIERADVVLTGEGRFDESSLAGKGPGSIARNALATNKRVHVFAGALAVKQPPAGLALHAITPPGTPLTRALAEAPRNLRRAVATAFRS